MNIQEYISSGIVESYVLGLAADAEREEFEQLSLRYPELVAARNAFEEVLESNAMENAVAPPAHLRTNVMQALEQEVSVTPKIIAMHTENNAVGRSKWVSYLAAASVVLLIGCAWLLYQQGATNEKLTSQNQDLQARFKSTDSILNKIIDEQRVIRDSNVTVVNMVGTQAAPHSSANIYWDSTSTNVFLVVKNMPKLPNDQQYQLWALIDGKPKDLGVFDASDDKVILKMKNTQKAGAFAITIEQKGGSGSPTLEKMQSMGKTNPL